MPISDTCNIHPLPKTDSSPRNPRKTIVLAASRRLSKGQPRNATLQHHARDILGNKLHQARGIYPIHLYETQTDRRCICLARPNPAAAWLGSRGDVGSNLSTLFSFLSRMSPHRRQCHRHRHHATKQTSRSDVYLPAYHPAISPLGPNTRLAPPHLTAAALPKSVQTPMHDAILCLPAQAVPVFHIFLRCR